jgi:hypothetical protein
MDDRDDLSRRAVDVMMSGPVAGLAAETRAARSALCRTDFKVDATASESASRMRKLELTIFSGIVPAATV